ncbi:hypothetical protein Tco_0787472 [Tanacetum coccineum]
MVNSSRKSRNSSSNNLVENKKECDVKQTKKRTICGIQCKFKHRKQEVDIWKWPKEFDKEWYEEGDEDSNQFERNTISEIQREKEFDGNSCCVVMGVNEFVDGANGSEGNLVLKSNFWLLVDEYERNMLKVNKKSDTVYGGN